MDDSPGIRSPNERDAGFTALGDLAAALAEDGDDDGAGGGGAGDDRESSVGEDSSRGGSQEGSFRGGMMTGGGGGGGSEGPAHSRGGVGASTSASGSPDYSPINGWMHEPTNHHRGSNHYQGSNGHHGHAHHHHHHGASSGGGGGGGGGSGRTSVGVRALERYLPEIAGVVQEVCIARGKAQGATGKSGLRPAPQLEPGTAEALLCSGALARSIGPAWEPHVRVLLPSLFAGGLSAPLVDALAGSNTGVHHRITRTTRFMHTQHAYFNTQIQLPPRLKQPASRLDANSQPPRVFCLTRPFFLSNRSPPPSMPL